MDGEVDGIDIYFVQSILDRITYKPGWKFTLDVRNERVYLFAWVNQDTDSRTGVERTGYKTSKRIPIDWPLSAKPDSIEKIMAWVRHAIHEWESHEADEWLRIDEELVHDPHMCIQCLIGGCRA